MKTYRVPELTRDTPDAAQVRLLRALSSVEGVSSAQLYPLMGLCAIMMERDHAPQFLRLLAAARGSGFSLERPERVP